MTDVYQSDRAQKINKELEKKYGEWVKEKELGVIYEPEKTEINLFASEKIKPIKFELYTENSEEKIGEKTLKNRGRNFYTATINGDLKNKRYRLKLKKEGRETLALHPYTKAVTLNGDKGVILDTEKVKPEGWEEDSYVNLEKNVDAVIYETHVQDFTNHQSSNVEKRGKYNGFIEEGSRVKGTDIKTGLDHLKELGITHVQLMPISQNGSAMEKDEDSYNWGYDPENFFAPEGSYSVRPSDPEKRILEVKQMVKGLHEDGIGVIKDTVLNHTYVLGRNSLEKLAEETFFRDTNGSGCGNELASENPIVRKYMVDVVKHWQEEYHIDGFRFDLMALHDEETMKTIKSELENNNQSNILYGEPWKALGSELDSKEDENPMNRKYQINTGIGAFDDKARDGIKGSPDGDDRGYVTGDIMKNRDDIKDIITGEIDIYNGEPGEVIAYTTCHDGNTLYEKICKSAEEFTEKEKKRATMLANSIILTSQAVPFIHSGAEMLRKRQFDDNPYQGPPEKNSLNWNKKKENIKISDYYKELIKIRKNHPAFRIGDSDKIKEAISFFEDIELEKSKEGMVAFKLDYEEDEWDDIVVAHNPYHEEGTIELPTKGLWKVAVEGDISINGHLRSFKSDEYPVKEISTSILYR